MTKKKLAILIISVVLIIILLLAGIFAFSYIIVNKNSIGSDKAVDIALSDSGLSRDEVTVLKSKIDLDDGMLLYDVEFITDNSGEYEYSIKASDGTIIDRDIDIPDSLANTTSQQGTTAQPDTTQQTTAAESTSAKSTTASKEISIDKAKSIALKDAGISENDATIVSAHKEYDDGITYYEIEFIASSYKYDYEISMSGKILTFDSEKVIL